ncbi:MAG TPA: DUF4215 domain-containing protein [Kofleriaceae bacterium]|nr:DUF4215 domain-containing protein [Kofleriaceae bacterium]
MKRIALLAALTVGGCIFVDDSDGPTDPFCGDGHVNTFGGEQCDDGNKVNGDGCSASCAIEGPYCGDGTVDQASEQCDDGNTMSGDGCSAACLYEPVADAFISATWQLRNIATNTVAPCPTGFDTAALYNQPIDTAGNPVGTVIIDLFDCSSGAGTSAPLPAGVYQSWVEIADHNNTTVYAKSLSAVVDVTFSDKTLNVQILSDGGYFQLAWVLRGATSNNTLTCAQAGAAGGLEAVGTDVSNASNSVSDIWNCADGFGITGGYEAATYTISVSALNGQDASIGTAPALTNKVINPRNQVTDLGTVTVPITGM